MQRNVMAFAAIVFLLLGVLFGMQIMSFVFGNLGTTTSSLDPASRSILNESGFVNSTGYTLTGASDLGFASPVITHAVNTTSGLIITAANYTLNTVTGLVLNATSVEYNFVQFNYTYTVDSVAKIVSDSVVNNSLESIQTYTEQSDTQFNTAAIAITLLLLIAIFAIFWKIFMSKGGISGGKSEKNFS